MTTGLCQPGLIDDVARINARLESIALSLFVVTVGTIRMAPGSRLFGSGSIAEGLTMPGLNLARVLEGIPVSGGSMFPGMVAMVMGVGGASGAGIVLGAHSRAVTETPHA